MITILYSLILKILKQLYYTIEILNFLHQIIEIFKSDTFNLKANIIRY